MYKKQYTYTEKDIQRWRDKSKINKKSPYGFEKYELILGAITVVAGIAITIMCLTFGVTIL